MHSHQLSPPNDLTRDTGNLPFSRDLLNIVRPSSLLSPDAILDAIKTKNESRDMDLKYRGYLGKNLPL